MTEQQIFGSYRDTKGSVETNKWVEEQRALGNPKILPKDEWFKQNSLRIEVSNLRKEVKNLSDVVLKFIKSK